MTKLDDVIEIRDSEIDVEDIMARIRERIRNRRDQAEAQGLDYDRLTDERVSGNTDGTLSSDFYYDLRQARENANSIWISLSVVDRDIPLIGSLVRRARRIVHSLVLYYVNMLAGKQVVFNRSAASVLSDLASHSEGTDARIQELEAEVEALHERIAALEERNSVE